MSASGEGDSSKGRQLRTGGRGGQPNVDVRIKEIMVFICYFIIRKYLLSNMNLIFHNSVLDEYDLAVSNFFKKTKCIVWSLK